jgi:formylglycine-generating enzyme required for sulfatase activity
MRVLRLLARATLVVSIAVSASAVTMDWTSIGHPGNAPGSWGGAVSYVYSIGTYEVTNAQYVEFLNAKAASDPLGLYDAGMGSGHGGITRTGVLGSYTYSAIAGRADMSVNFVSFYDALRFANWMNNGQGIGDTESGAYSITAEGITDNSITRNPGATIFLANRNEWHKAAYHSATGLSASDYFLYPAGSNTQTACATPTSTANRANCNNAVGDVTNVGSYTGSASPWGTFDQGGNVWEWSETLGGFDGEYRLVLGGSFSDIALILASQTSAPVVPMTESPHVGFRIAMIPEPGTGLLVIAGLLGLAAHRRGCA